MLSLECIEFSLECREFSLIRISRGKRSGLSLVGVSAVKIFEVARGIASHTLRVVSRSPRGYF